MRTYTSHKRVASLAAIIWFSCLTATAAASSADTIEIGPRRIEIGTFFSGGDIRVSATIPPGCDAVFEMVGKEVEEDLMRKGRHWDIWMNVDEIDIKGVPRLYYVASNRPGLLNTDQGQFPWGYASLEQSATFEDKRAKVGRDELFREFIRLMEEKELYAMWPSAVKITADGADSALAQVRLPFSTRIAPGVYDVRLSIIQGHTVVARRHGTVEVALVRLPLLLDSLASAHRWFYGLLAVVVAASVGFLSGIAFRSKGS
jgi:hypothetical protein